MPLASGTTLGGFEILGPLGKGGMGEVYRARDIKLGRDVAIKVLPEDFAADQDRLERFEREAKMLAALSHAHIGALYEFRDDDGIRYLVLELVEGESLQDRIDRGPIPLREALSLFIQIAEALEAAHAKDIIHRDLKPGNVQLSSDGVVKVLDFGLARPVEAATTPPRTRTPTEPTLPHDPNKITTYGSIIGTPSYMSPEQVRGTEIDQRSDIWAFGCCLFEALSGIRPFFGETRTDVLASIVHEEPDWSRLPEDLPRELRALLRRCLEKVPKRRLSAAGDIAAILQELADDLKHAARESGKSKAVAAPSRSRSWLTVLVSVLVVAVGVVGAALSFLQNQSFRMDFGAERDARSASTLPRPKIDRIAVLPFLNQGDPSQEAFTDGMRDALNTELAKVSSIKLIGRMAAERYKDTELSPKEIAAELGGIDAFVNATVLRDEGDNVRITVDLMDPETQETIWTQPYERPLQNIFQLHSEVALQIVREIEAVITPQETQRIKSVQPEVVPAAYDAYLRGETLWAPDETSMNAAMAEYQKAVEIDPGFAKGWIALGDAHWGYEGWGVTPASDHIEKGRTAFDQAFKLDPEQPEVLAALAQMRWKSDREFADAERMYRQAMELATDDANVLLDYAFYLAVTGRWKEAGEYTRSAIELEADDPWISGLASRNFFLSGDYGASLNAARHAHKIDPNDTAIRTWLAVAYAFTGDHDKAVALAEETARLGGNDLIYATQYGAHLFAAGRADEAQVVVLEALEGFDKDDDRGLAWRFLGQLILGNVEQALDLANRGAAIHDAQITEALRAWVYMPLGVSSSQGVRQDPRYWDLIEQIGYPPLPPEHPGYAEEQEWLVRRKAEELLADRGDGGGPKVSSLAVLPLRNLSPQGEQDYFAESMTEAITTELAKIEALKIRGRTSAMQYKDSEVGIPDIAEALDVDALIEGSVTRAGDEVRINVTLQHGATDAQLWTGEYKETITSVLKLQSDVALAIADAVNTEVTGEERDRIATAREVKPEAHEAYVLGWHLRHTDDQDKLPRVIELFQTAVDLDPSFAEAWVGLATAYIDSGDWFAGSAHAYKPKAKEALLRALEIDNTLGEAYGALCEIASGYDYDFEAARRYGEKAIALAPNSSITRARYAGYLFHVGRINECVEQARLAIELDPDDPLGAGWSASGLLKIGEYDVVRTWTETFLAKYPDHPQGLRQMVYLARLESDADKGLGIFRANAPKIGNELETSEDYAEFLAWFGRVEEARTVAQRAIEAKGDSVDAGQIACTFINLGELDRGFEWLDKAMRQRLLSLNGIRSWAYAPMYEKRPGYQALHADERFWELCDKIGLPPFPPDHPGYGDEQRWMAKKAVREMLKEQGGEQLLQRIAVMPFENYSGDPEQQYFVNGMTDALAAELQKLSGLLVLSSSATRSYRDTELSPREIADELGVDGLVTGSVYRSGDDLRIIAELTDPKTLGSLWSQTYEDTMENVIVVQGKVTLAIADAIRVAVTEEEHTRIATDLKIDPKAYEVFLRGNESFTKSTPQGYEDATRLYDEAHDLEPKWTAPLLAAAQVHYKSATDGLAPSDTGREKMRRYAEEVLTLDPYSGEAYAIIASALWRFDYQWVEAEQRYEKALALSPNSTMVRVAYAEFLNHTGRRKESVAQLDAALKTAGKDAWQLRGIGEELTDAGQPERALPILEQVVSEMPDDGYSVYYLSTDYWLQGLDQESIAVLERVRQRFADPLPALDVTLALRRAAAQPPEEAKAVLETLKQQYAGTITPVAPHLIDLYRGDIDSALDVVTSAYQSGVGATTWLLRVAPYLYQDRLPIYRELRKSPRFWELVDQVGFPPLPPDHPGYAEEQEWMAKKAAREMLREQGAGGEPPIQSIAVLPFENQSGDDTQEYFVDGMTGSLTAELSKISSIKVIGRVSAMHYKGSEKTPPEIAEELGVDGLITGTVLRDGETVRISAELMHAASQTQLWSQSYDNTMENILKLHSEVALDIAGEIRAELTAEEKASYAAAEGVNPAAYDLYLQGRELMQSRLKDDVEAAITLFKRAIAVEPDFALPYSGLADGYTLSVVFLYMPSKEAAPLAKDYASQAVELDDESADAHASMGYFLMALGQDVRVSERELRRAITLNPGLVRAHRWLGSLLGALGRTRESYEVLAKAIELDPVAPHAHTDLAMTHMANEALDKAFEETDLALKLDASLPLAWMLRVLILADLGRCTEAAEILEQLKPNMSVPWYNVWMARVMAGEGNQDQALAFLSATDLDTLDPQLRIDVAIVYAALGDTEQALHWLRISEGFRALSARVASAWKSLRDDPRFWDAIGTFNLPPLPPEHPAYEKEQAYLVRKKAEELVEARAEAERAQRISSIAVLPFENQSGDDTQEYFVDGMTGSLTAELSKIASIKVIGRASAMHYKGTQKTPPEIAEELGVDGLITGTALRDGETVRISAELVHAASQTQLWSQSYDNTMENILKLHSEVALDIAEEMRAKLTVEEKAGYAAAQGVDPAAYDAYLQGRELMQSRLEKDFDAAITLFEHAISIDSNFALPYSGLADAYTNSSVWTSMNPDEAVPLARKNASEAIALDETLADAHASMGLVQVMFGPDWGSGEQELRRAIALNPGLVRAHRWLGSLLILLGRTREGFETLKHAVELDPVAPHAYADLAALYYSARDYPRALEQTVNALEHDPTLPAAMVYRVMILSAMGRRPEAAELLQSMTPYGSGLWIKANIARLAAEDGEMKPAETLLADLDLDSADPKLRDAVSALYATLGNTDEALRWLGAASWFKRAFARLDPQWEPLYDNPHFWEIFEPMNLPLLPPEHPVYAEEQAYFVRKKADELLKEREAAERAQRISSIAVLPFENQSGDDTQEYFVDGMTGALTSELSKIASITVIGRASAMHFKGTEKTPPEIAEELAVDGLISGTALRDGETVRISAELMHAQSQTQLWSQSYDNTMDNILKLHSQVALDIAEEIRAELTAEEKASYAAAKGVNPAAYDAYLQGRERMQSRLKDDVSAAIALHQRAIAIDPTFAMPYSGLADAYTVSALYSYMTPDEAAPLSKEYARKAIALDGDLADAHASMGFYHQIFGPDLGESEREHRRAIALNPGLARAHSWLGALLGEQGRISEGLAEAYESIKLEPKYAQARTGLGILYYCNQQFEDALEQLDIALELDPDLLLTYIVRVKALSQMGRHAEATKLLEELKVEGLEVWRSLWLAKLAADGGDKSQAETLHSTVDLKSIPPQFRTDAGLLYLTLGDAANALRALKDSDWSRAWWARVDPAWKPLLDDTGFWEVVESMKLPPLPPEHPVYAKEQAYLIHKKAEELVEERAAAERAVNVSSIAVLPLRNLSPQGEQDYFAESMTEAITTELAKIKALKIRGRTSAMQFKDTELSIPEIAGALDVDALVEGSVTREGDDVRISVTLQRGTTDAQLWTGEYTETITSVLALQSEVALAIADAISTEITGEERDRISTTREVAPKAHEAYVLGKYLYRTLTQDGMERAIEQFKTAVTFDPNFAEAWIALGTVYIDFADWKFAQPDETKPKAREAFQKAIEIDPGAGEAYGGLAELAISYDYDWEAAGRYGEQGIALAPNSAITHARYGEYLQCVGRTSEAVQHARAAMALDPGNTTPAQWAAYILMRAGEVDEVRNWADTYVTGHSDNIGELMLYVWLYRTLGMEEEAFRERQDSERLTGWGADPELLAWFGHVDEANAALATLLRDKVALEPSNVARAYVELEALDSAFEWFEIARKEKPWYMVFFKVWPYLNQNIDRPAWKEFRADDRYWELCEKMGYPPFLPDHPGYAEEQEWKIQQAAKKLVAEQAAAGATQQ